MTTDHLRPIIKILRASALRREELGRTDGELLDQYVRSREEAAFAELMRRHGRMVWGVCRRLLGSHHDAEDAYQATFLVLSRKAASVIPREAVANWLFGVARQTALKARMTMMKRRAREKQMTTMPEPCSKEQELWDNIRPLLDQEMGHLPAKYRVLIILCDLEGMTLKEVARQFDLPQGTVASRLATARTMLVKRLTRQGLGVSAGILPTMLAQNAASACVPVEIIPASLHAARVFSSGSSPAIGGVSAKAAALAEDVLKAMLVAKLKIATLMLIMVGVFVSGAAAATHNALAELPADRKVLADATLAGQQATETAEGNKEFRKLTGVVDAVNLRNDTLTVKEGRGVFRGRNNMDFRGTGGK
jgi:RNA polymerase sigma factor (sigma-70 family)